jgi:hypothetical protein
MAHVEEGPRRLLHELFDTSCSHVLDELHKRHTGYDGDVWYTVEDAGNLGDNNLPLRSGNWIAAPSTT